MSGSLPVEEFAELVERRWHVRPGALYFHYGLRVFAVGHTLDEYVSAGDTVTASIRGRGGIAMVRVRFDVIACEVDADQRWQIRHWPAAFDAGG